MKRVGFHWPENPFSLAIWKIRFKNTFAIDEKMAELAEKWFALARRSFSTNRNAELV